VGSCSGAKVNVFLSDLGDGARLRLLEHRHAANVYVLVDANRDHLRRWLPWVDGTRSMDDSREFIRSSLEQFARGDGFNAGIWQDHQLAGLIGLFGVHAESRKAEIGYWLGQEYTGRGLMTRACAAVLDYAFDELNLHRVVIRCAVENETSCAVARRLGFVFEGVTREDGWLYDRFVSHNVFSLLETEWRAQKGT
jgi:ribosomal-protein-serine acetyltransferase